MYWKKEAKHTCFASSVSYGTIVSVNCLAMDHRCKAPIAMTTWRIAGIWQDWSTSRCHSSPLTYGVSSKTSLSRNKSKNSVDAWPLNLTVAGNIGIWPCRILVRSGFWSWDSAPYPWPSHVMPNFWNRLHHGFSSSHFNRLTLFFTLAAGHI